MTYPLNTDYAGDNRYSAYGISELPEDYMPGELDYPGDVDYYSFLAFDSVSGSIWLEAYNNYTLKLSIYNSSGILIASQTAVDYVSVSLSLEIDESYYIAITSPDYTSYDYGWCYLLGFSF